MWLNNIETPRNSYELTKEELHKAVIFIKDNSNSSSIEFYNKGIEWLNEQINIRTKNEKENYFPYRDPYLLVYKAMVIMKENGALHIAQLDKLDKKYKTINDDLLFDIDKDTVIMNWFELSAKEFIQAIVYIKNNHNFLSSFLINKGMEWIYYEIDQIKLIEKNKLEYDKSYLLALKTIAIILANGFRSINEFIKLMGKEKDTLFEQDKNNVTNKLKTQEEAQKSKDWIKAEIVKYFMLHEDKDVMHFIEINSNNWYEEINLLNCSIEIFVDWKSIGKEDDYDLEMKSTDESGGKFTKTLAIDKATDIRGILITGGTVNIEEIEYEDISKFHFPVETLFIYREDWKNHAKVFTF